MTPEFVRAHTTARRPPLVPELTVRVAADGSGEGRVSRGYRGPVVAPLLTAAGRQDPHGIPVTSAAELGALLGVASAAALRKERTALHDLDRAWLAASPFCLVATSGVDGSCDVSPKGDPPGFALVLDEHTLALPERAGNRRADGLRNILVNPHVGLVFFLPGRGDTLRINGRAGIVRDAPFLDDMVVRGHRPVLAVVVAIEQVYHHCAKAFLRSTLWDPATWRPDAVPSRARIAQALERPEQSLAEVEAHYGAAYADGLYPSAPPR